MAKKIRNKLNLLRLRLKAAYLILFRPERAWVFMNMDSEQIMKFIEGHSDYKLNVLYHRMDEKTLVDILNGVNRENERKMSTDPLKEPEILSKKHLN